MRGRLLKDEDKGGEDTKTVSLLKSYVVFNLDQIDDLPEVYQAVHEAVPEPDRIGDIEEFVTLLNIDIAHGGGRAAYNPRHDAIVMPLLSEFEEPEHYYATLFHELGHNAELRIMPRSHPKAPTPLELRRLPSA